MNKILAALLKANYFIVGIGIAYIVLAQSKIAIPIEYEYTMAIVSLLFVLADTLKTISNIIQNNEVDNYRYNFLCDLKQDDLSEFICLTDFKNRKRTDILVGILNYCSTLLIILGFCDIILLPLKNYDTSANIDITNITLIAFAFVFFNVFLNGVSDNLSGYYHEIFKTRYLLKRTQLLADKAADLAGELFVKLENTNNPTSRSTDAKEGLLDIDEVPVVTDKYMNSENQKEKSTNE